MLSIPAAFWPPFLGLKNEYVGINDPQGMPLHFICHMKFDELLVHNRRHVLVSAFLLLVLLSLFTMFDNVAFFEEDIL